MDYVWLITLDIFDSYDKPLAVCTNAVDAFTIINNLTNAYLKKRYGVDRSNILVFRTTLNESSDVWECWTVEALLRLANEQTPEVSTKISQG